MKDLSESVGLLVGVLGIAGAAATAAYFTWDQRSLGAANESLAKENELHQSRIEDLEDKISRLESKIDASKIRGVESETFGEGNNPPLVRNSKKEEAGLGAANPAQLVQAVPSAEKRVKRIKTKGAFRFEGVGCRVANGDMQCGAMISNITELERSLGIRASNAAMTDIKGDSYRASNVLFRGQSSSASMRHTMATSSTDKATWVFKDIAPGTVPAKLSFTVSDQYRENNRSQSRDIYEELEMWLN